MKNTSKRTISTLLTLALALGLLTAVPMTAGAASNATTIDIGDSWFGNTDYSTENWSYNQSTHAIQAASNVTVVGVTGRAGTRSVTTSLKLSISL